ncbi:gamma-aminobutyric acid type B receptor subunit 1-like [Mya arenaria]|uniref:gamma-aminobutyric acid type B receptor subunit 1-like n=1 Tax=Mya arenaria TaxID=6604 RepID=UPI0022E2FBF8|nr:gamma-aminobutyric acid type B receptor subunit 1-like [Mya arenaria]
MAHKGSIVGQFRFALLFVLILTESVTSISGLRELRLLGQLPMTGTAWTGGMACLPPLKMAIEDVNARPGILDGYKLTYEYIDSMCSKGPASYRTFRTIHEKPPYVMLLGDACSTSSESTAEVSHFYNLTQLSYGSTSPVLSDRERFPKFFRLSPPDTTINPTRIDLMRTFNWNKIATIHEALEFFSVSMDTFIRDVKNLTEIEIISQEVFVHDPYNRVKNMKDRDVRIIVALMYEDKARKMLCAAYKVGLYGAKIVWIMPGWFTNEFWKDDIGSLSCTLEQITEVVEGAIFAGPIWDNPIEERGIANMTRHNKTLDEFTYEDADIGEEIFKCLSRVTLVGVSSRISFGNGADSNKIIKVQRVQGGKRKLIAYYHQDKSPSYFEWVQGALVWKDNKIPRDSTYISVEEVTVPLTLYTSMCVLAGTGLCATVSLFAFNIVYRTNRFVKLSSPNINNVLLLGCFLCYATVFIRTTGADSRFVCEARSWCFCLGFTITFGSLFSKTWRVYRIFTNKKLLRRTIKDYQLLAINGILVASVMVVLGTSALISPSQVVTKYLTKEVNLIGYDEEVHPYVRVCYSKYASYFNWVIYILEGALLSFGAFLAWETRRVKIEALNDSHQIGFCLYNVVVLSAVGLLLSLVLGDHEVLLYGITSACLIIGTFATQMVVFIPKNDVASPCRGEALQASKE